MKNQNKNIDINLTLGEVNALIGDIYHAALTNEWVDVLDDIIDATQSNKAYFFIQKLRDPHPLLLEFQATFDYNPNILKDYNRHFKADPFYNVTKVATEGEALNVNSYVDVNDLKETAYYKMYFAPLRTYYCLTGILIRNAEYDSTIVINRGESDQPYSSQDMNLIKLLTPHFSLAAHTFHTLSLYKNYATISKSILDKTDKVIVVCDENCSIILCNVFAKEKLEQTKLACFSCGELRLNDALYNAQFRSFVKQCTTLSFTEIHHQKTIFIDNGSCNENILLTLSPIVHNFGMNDIPCCLVLITFEQLLNWEVIRTEFNLTNKELQLLKGIYSKKKLNDLTSIFKVTYNTLRVHLQSIFKKVGVNSQIELIIKLSVFKR